MLSRVDVTSANCGQVASKLRERTRANAQLRDSVSEIVSDVRARKDAALREYCMRFDGADLSRASIAVADSEIDTALKRADPVTVKSLRYSMKKISRVQRELVKRIGLSMNVGGFHVSAAPRPIPSVGCYVPGGRASYASSVLMTAGVAKTAGVQRIVLCTPGSAGGRVTDEILAAARIAGVDEVYRVGGAQSIAAMAYGTESMGPVSKIVGPGGMYVSVAKQIVSADVATDFYAGPTEIVVFADDSLPPRTAAWDLVAQAEHGTETFCGLVTVSEEYASKVSGEISKLLPSLVRGEHVRGAIANGFAAVCEDEAIACKFINALSPEHLEIVTHNPERAASKIGAAGLKLLGKYAPCSASDYVVGTDHVIPTGGFSVARGPLSVLDFVKLDWSVSGSRTGLRRALGALRALSEAEGLPNHHLSAESRYRRDGTG